METVRAKLVVQEKTDYSYGDYVKLKMVPVFSNDPNSENKLFWDATPNGLFEMTCKRAAADRLVLGKEYYVDMTPVGGE